MSNNLEQATLGGGCFWCTEAVFSKLKGITLCESGYSGGATPNPDYNTVCAGESGHAEVIRLHYDANVISFHQILTVFFATHDPTTLNQQGNDKGTQYRSVIFFHSPAQHNEAIAFVQELEKHKVYSNKVITEISPLINYFPAEQYHQEYFENNPKQAYCAYVVAPKVQKVKQLFGDLLNG